MPKPETVIKMEDYSLFYNTNPALAKAHGHWKSYSGKNTPPPCVRKISITSRINLTSCHDQLYFRYNQRFERSDVVLPQYVVEPEVCPGQNGLQSGERLVSILTMAHMYGLAFELIYPFASGTHVYFISKTPAPKIINEIFSAVRPNLIVAVPLIIEKIIKHRYCHNWKNFISSYPENPLSEPQIKAVDPG